MSVVRKTILGITGCLLAASMASRPQALGPRTVYLSVEDKSKKPIADLKPEELRVFEDGKAQTVTSLTTAGTIPLSVTFLVDAGFGAQRVRDDWRKEIGPFLNALLRPSIDTAQVIAFNQQSVVMQQSTDQVPLLLAAFDKLIFGPGPIATNDAITRAVRQAGKGSNRRVLVIISDGVDTTLNMLDEPSIKPAQEEGVRVYGVTINRPLPTDTFGAATLQVGRMFLVHIAEQTGGRAVVASPPKDLQNFFTTVADELRLQYVVTYTPTDNRANGKFRKIKIETTRKDTKARYPSGYYATNR
jgi:VWFA-related protein